MTVTKPLTLDLVCVSVYMQTSKMTGLFVLLMRLLFIVDDQRIILPEFNQVECYIHVQMYVHISFTRNYMPLHV